MQAFGRVFRIGQKEKTSLLRLIATDTVDEKMDSMQEAKTKAIQAVMGGAGDPNKRPSLQELMELFDIGDTENPFVIADERKDERNKTILQDNAYMRWNGGDDEQRGKRRWI
jgi:hypothetical protein